MSKKPKFVDNVDRKKWDLKEYEERARKRAEFGDDYFDKQEKSSSKWNMETSIRIIHTYSLTSIST